MSIASPEKLVTVVGPLKSRDDAEKTVTDLGSVNHSVYSRAIKDVDGYDTDESEWFVERDMSIVPQNVFGYDWKDIQRMQQRR
jgi:hypothetical protein